MDLDETEGAEEVGGWRAALHRCRLRGGGHGRKALGSYISREFHEANLGVDKRWSDMKKVGDGRKAPEVGYLGNSGLLAIAPSRLLSREASANSAEAYVS